jgi:hypothetical protein
MRSRLPPVRCRACGEFRPYDSIEVKKLDTSASMGLPEGTMVENFQYCGDRPECRQAAEDFKGYFASGG